MGQVFPSPDCGNSPKNQFAQAIAIAIEQGDRAYLEGAAHKDLKVISTQGQSISPSHWLDDLQAVEAPLEIHIRDVSTHGKVGAVTGSTKLASGAETRFCHTLRFATASARQVLRIESFH